MSDQSQPIVHWCVFSDGEPACGAVMPEPPSRKPFSWPDHYPRVTPSQKDVTCEACKERCSK
jgi:hypothetical protein